MLNDEAMRLKEELDCVKAKVDELNKALCAQLEENKCLSRALKAEGESRAQALKDLEFLRGKVEAYEFVLSKGVCL